MAAPVRTLGFRSRAEAIVHLAYQGLSASEIAARINAAHPDTPTNPIAVSSRLTQLRRQGQPVPLALPLDAEDYLRLTDAARARGSRPDHLARRLIEAVLRDNLVGAVLDDTGETS